MQTMVGKEYLNALICKLCTCSGQNSETCDICHTTFYHEP